MIEIPEAVTLAAQITETFAGLTISGVEVGHSPHKFAWYYGEPGAIPSLLEGCEIAGARAVGGFVEIAAGGARLLFSEGMRLSHQAPGDTPPAKHQLRVEFSDGSALTASALMYGGLGAVPAADDDSAATDNEYYQTARAKPSPLHDAFNRDYFATLLRDPDAVKGSAKAFLATEQRIPGLGNGVLQDILYEAGLHPRFPMPSMASPDDPRARRLFEAIRTVLSAMAAAGGRDTEQDLHGATGGYHTRMSRFTVGTPCGRCGSTIQKQSYLGGSVYFCPRCQALS